MNTSDEKPWMRDRPTLLAMVVRFNTLSPSSIHPDRAPDWLKVEAAQKVSSTPRGQRRLSEALRRWVKVNAQGYYDFQPFHRRFALLEVSTLERLAAFTGAALLSSHLSRIVRRDEIGEAKRALGNELFDFATKRARFLSAEGLASPSPSPPTADAVHRLGWTHLEQCLAGESHELLRRLQLKLPPEVSLEDLPTEPGKDKLKIATMMRKILISEIDPELAPCFT